MSASINEHTQFTNTNGKPFVNGKVYFGQEGADPVLNPIAIFAERSLTVPLPNPIELDSFGRTVQKVWIGGRYSMRVNDNLNVQQYIDLDLGADATSNTINLTNVAGINDITGEATPNAILAYIDLQTYSFKIANTNTDAVTLDIDNLGAKDIVLSSGAPLTAGQFVQNENAIVQYNATTDRFTWLNETATGVDPLLLLSTGMTMAFIGLIAPLGWILADGGTIGSFASGASTRNNEDTRNLYTMFWNNMSDAAAPVLPGGRGASADADFDADKTLGITDSIGRSVFGTGPGQTAEHGGLGGTEEETLTIAEMPSHTHTQSRNSSAPRSGGGVNGGSTYANLETQATGGGGAHNNMPPFASLTWIIKL